jgi:hypothetical protein
MNLRKKKPEKGQTNQRNKLKHLMMQHRLAKNQRLLNLPDKNLLNELTKKKMETRVPQIENVIKQ